jgi:hypothetical protein
LSRSGKKARLLNALKQVIICKTDSGHSSFAYARVASDFGAGQFVNLWQPASTGGRGRWDQTVIHRFGDRCGL